MKHESLMRGIIAPLRESWVSDSEWEKLVQTFIAESGEELDEVVAEGERMGYTLEQQTALLMVIFGLI